MNQPVRAAYHADRAVRLVDHVGLLSAVRYLTAESQGILLEVLDDDLRTRVRSWCDQQGCIGGAQQAPVLTPRERQILMALCHDRTAPQIAEDLGVSVNTVKTLTRRLYRKLGVGSRHAAAELAIQLRLV